MSFATMGVLLFAVSLQLLIGCITIEAPVVPTATPSSIPTPTVSVPAACKEMEELIRTVRSHTRSHAQAVEFLKRELEIDDMIEREMEWERGLDRFAELCGTTFGLREGW